MSSHSKDTDDLQCSKLEISSENEGEIECAVCLLTAVHPVRLPCSHIFCYLCVKGIANRSKKCALCRQEISPQFLLKPNLLKSEDLDKDTSFEDGYQWYYEGNRGWWQYDERTSQELESNFKENKEKKLEMLIAGFLYIIDFEGMVQFRRNDPNRRRKIKRDLISIPKKGIAGLRVKKPEVTVPERMVGDGNDSEDISSTNQISSNAMSSQVQNNNPDNNNQSLSSSSSINNEPQGDNTDDRLNRNDSSYPSSINNVGNRTETLQYVQVVDVHDDSTTATVATQSINNSGVQTESDSSAAEDAIQSTMANLRLNEDANVTTSSSENATGLWKL